MNCAGCHGHGTLDDGVTGQEIPCPDCDGTGLIEIDPAALEDAA